jgi:hypothetical protein
MLIGRRVRSVRWYADPPKFYEIQLGEDGRPLLTADRVHIRTGRVLKGNAARRLMEQLNEVKRIETKSDGSKAEVRGKLPPNWVLDDAWEYGLKWLRDVDGNIIYRNGQPIPLPSGQRGMFYGRRHAYEGFTERGVRVVDTQDIKHVTWWKARYPDIPYRPLTQDYWWYKDDGFVTEVLDVDVEIILLGCVGEFMDISDVPDQIKRPDKPIELILPRQ